MSTSRPATILATSISAMSARTIIWLTSPISNSTVPPESEIPDMTISPISTPRRMTIPAIGASTRTSSRKVSASAVRVRLRLAFVSRTANSSSARRRLFRVLIKRACAASKSVAASILPSNRDFLRSKSLASSSRLIRCWSTAARFWKSCSDWVGSGSIMAMG